MENQALKVGQEAPDFELLNQDRLPVKLSAFRGKKSVVLLFYPMDFSPVCSAEHCSFGKEITQIAADDDTLIFGVSTDSPYSHAAFKKEYEIPYDLLADTSRKMVKAYGMFAGEVPYNCSKRGTVVVGMDGRIAYYHEQPMKEARTVRQLVEAVQASAAA